MASESANQSPMARVAFKWLAAFNALDFNAIAELLTDDYEHHILPSSMGRPPMKKAAWLEFIIASMKLFDRFSAEVLETTESSNKVVFHARSDGMSKTGNPYKNEYMLVLTFDETDKENPKISRVQEFVDSAFSKEFFGRERAAYAARQQVEVAA